MENEKIPATEEFERRKKDLRRRVSATVQEAFLRARDGLSYLDLEQLAYEFPGPEDEERHRRSHDHDAA